MRYLVYDIETIPESSTAPDWEPKQLCKGCGACLHNPDPFPDLHAHRIVTIGMLLLQDDLILRQVGCAAQGWACDDEKAKVRRFIDVVSPETTLVDFNGRGFDMPVIQSRALHYGLAMPFYFAPQPDNYGKVSSWSKTYRDRYAGRHLDLCDEWSNYGSARRPSLHTLARTAGMPGKGTVDGSDVARLYREKRYGEIDRYCLEDVYQTAILFLRWLHLKGELPADVARDRITSILAHMGESGEHEVFLSQLDRERLLP
jgi:3'-5' exonuclease